MAVTGILHTYHASVEIDVSESAENFVNRGVLHFEECVNTLHVDFTDGFAADVRRVADIAQDVATAEIV